MELDRRHVQTTDQFVADDLRQMQLAPRYNEWLFSLVRPYLGRRILEVGSGIGNMTRRLAESTEYVFGIEPNLACVAELERALGSNPRVDYRPWRVEQCDVKVLLQYRFDTVVCVNVLEHIEDDVQALRFFRRVLHNSGQLILLVPAVSWAYGPIDRALGHFRRYSKADLLGALRQVGFGVEILKYSNLLGLVGWLYNARVKRIVRQSDMQIRAFDSLVPWCARLENVVSPPIGMSLLVVGRKEV